MTHEEFEAGFKLLEQNFCSMALELKVKIWEKMKDLPVDMWDKICDKLLEQEFKFPNHPILADFMGLRSEFMMVKVKQKCLRCLKDAMINDDPEGHFCDDCYKYINSPAGLVARKKFRENLNKLLRSLQ